MLPLALARTLAVLGALAFTLGFATPARTQDATCLGICAGGGSGSLCPCTSPEVCTGFLCQLPPGFECASSADCTGGQDCTFLAPTPGTCSISGTTCFTQFDCPLPFSETCEGVAFNDAGLCVLNGDPLYDTCTSDPECPAGTDCIPLPSGPSVCATDTVCGGPGTCPAPPAPPPVPSVGWLGWILLTAALVGVALRLRQARPGEPGSSP